jgi:hypothetical protein
MAIMPMVNPVTDPEERAELARWVVSLRRAHAFPAIGQATGKLHHRVRQLDATQDGYDRAAAGQGYRDTFCCLGIWCALKVAQGQLALDPGVASEYGTISYGPISDGPSVDVTWSSGALPNTVHLARSADPDLLRIVKWSDDSLDDFEEDATDHGYADGDAYAEGEASTLTAAELNDDIGLSFDRIADVITWSFQLAAEELATAELAPRVPEVEGAA